MFGSKGEGSYVHICHLHKDGINLGWEMLICKNKDKTRLCMFFYFLPIQLENGLNKRNFLRERSRRQVASADVDVDLVTPSVEGFLVNIAENVRNTNSWNNIQARFWILGSDAEVFISYNFT